MIKYNPLYKNDGQKNGALTTPPSESIVFDVPGQCIWVKGVKLKGTDTTYTFSHDNYITLTNTPGDPEDIKIGVAITTLKAAIDTTYEAGTAVLLNAGTDTINRVWAARILADYVKASLPTTKKMKINGIDYALYTTESSLPNFLAPTSVGTVGQVLASNGTTLTWIDLSLNTDYQVTLAPVTTDNDFRVLLKQSINDTAETTFIYFGPTLTYNPNRKILKINNNKVITIIDTYVGATASANATTGLVPAAASALRNYFLRGDGSWQPIAAENTWRPIRVEGTERLGVGIDTGALNITAGTGIGVSWDATNKRVIITNNAPDVPDNTDRTAVYKGTVSGTKVTNSTLIVNNSNTGLVFEGGINLFKIGDGTNYIEIPITIDHGLSTKNMKINGINYAIYTSANSLPTFIAPGGLGTANQILATNASGNDLAWVDKPVSNVSTSAVVSNSASGTTQISSNQVNPYYNLLEGGAVAHSIQFKAGTGISISASTGGVITITNDAPDVNHNTHYITTMYIGENNDTQANRAVANNPYLKLFDDTARRSTLRFVAGTGIIIGSDANGNITITNSAPDLNHNTDYTTVNKGTAGSATVVSQVKVASSGGVIFEGGTNEFKIGDGYNYFKIPITPSFTVTDKAANILTSATTLATINGTDITAKVTVVDSSPTLTTSLQTIATIAGVAIKAKITNYNTDENVKLVPKTDNVNRPLMMINGSTSTGELISTSMFSTGIYANASSKMITANGFIKNGSDDTYVLTGGGGHYSFNNILHGDSYGTMEGVISNCNSVAVTGIYSSSGFSNRPAGVGNWGTLFNLRLYNSNNLYHRQLFFDCYDSDRIWTRSDNNGTWTSWKELITNANISPSMLISGDTIAVSVGGVTSNYITVPYATLAGTIKVTDKSTHPSGGEVFYIPMINTYSGNAYVYGSADFFMYRNSNGNYLNIGKAGITSGITFHNANETSGAYGDLIPAACTAYRSWTLPDKTGTIALISDIPNYDDKYVKKVGDTMTGSLYHDGETSSVYKIDRKRAGGGGWAYTPFWVRGNDNASFFNIGVYGDQNTLEYGYIGVGSYSSVSNLRVASTYIGTTTLLANAASTYDIGSSTYPYANLYLGKSNGAGIYYVGSKNTYRMIRFIDNTSDVYGNGISIGGGGLTVLGSGESADTLLSSLSLTASGGAETTYIASDGNIMFYPNINSWDASGLISMTAGRLWVGVNGDTTRENQIGLQSGAGQILMYAHPATSGSRGIWVPAHGTGSARIVFNVDTNNKVTFADAYNGTSTALAYSQAGLAASAITWLTCWNGYELRAISKQEVYNCISSYITLPSHNHDDRYLRYEGWWTSGNGNNADNANGMVFAYSNHNVPGPNWGILTTFDYQYNSAYKMQLFSNGYTNGYTYYRNRSSDRGGWNAWVRLIDSVNWKEVMGFSSAVGSSSVPIYWTGSAFATCIVSFGNSSYGEHNANNINDNGLKYYTSNGPSTSLGATTSDGALYSQAYSTSWVAQIAQDYRNGGLYVRGKNNGTWQSWYRVWDNRTTYISGGVGYIGSTSITTLPIYGYSANGFSFHQTSGSFDGNSGWCHYLISNHGDGASYYHYTIGLPFWGVPIYKRQTGSTSSVSGWHTFITSENYTSYCATSGHSHTYYWANLSVQSSANYLTTPYFAYVLFRNTGNSGAAGYVGRGSGSSNEIQLCGYSGNAVNIGANNGSGHIYVNTSGNVGIGITSPSYKLHVSGDIGTSGNIYMDIDKYIYTKISSYNRGMLGTWSGYSALWLGYYTAHDSGYNTLIYGNNINLFYGTSATLGFTLNSSGNVGIGTSNPSYKLHVAGNIGTSGNMYAAHFYETSDVRLKHDIFSVSQSIRKFRFNNDNKLYYGFIAQELEVEHPELVDSSGEYKTVNYNSAICYYIAELENKVQKLEEKIKILENKYLN